MKELFEVQGNSIFTFSKGDYIIRTKPVVVKKEDYSMMMPSRMIEVIDNSYRTSPYEFLGVYNNLIYLRSLSQPLFGDKKYISKATLEVFENDWALFQVPDGLTIEDCA